MTVLEAAQSDEELVALRAMRDTLAAAMDLAAERGDGTVAQLNAQLVKVLERIGELDRAGKVSLNDVLAERRVARAGRAESVAPAAGKAKRAS